MTRRSRERGDEQVEVDHGRCARGGPGNVSAMSDRTRKIAKPAAAFGVLATMASIWWFALRPRRKVKLDK